MKVIEKGTGQRGWSIEATCTGNGNGKGGCHAKLLVEQADIFRTESHARDETETYMTFECSACHVWTDLAKAKVPSHVQGAAPFRAPGSPVASCKIGMES